jgi:hypothetical protein
MYFKEWEYFMGQKKNGFRIEYFLMIIVSFFWAMGHPLGSMILQKIHPFQLGSLTLSIGFEKNTRNSETFSPRYVNLTGAWRIWIFFLSNPDV